MMALLLKHLISMLGATYRFTILNPEVLEKTKRDSKGGNCLLALWHRDILCFMSCFPHTPHVTIASQSQDGEIISRVLEKMNYKVARGSSSRGGERAIKEFVRLLEKGYSGAVTVDGPRGPAEVPKEGIFFMAKISGLTIVPVSFYPKSCYTFKKSWDGFRLPWPFTKISLFYGVPLKVSPDLPKENFNQLSELLKLRLESGGNIE